MKCKVRSSNSNTKTIRDMFTKSFVVHQTIDSDFFSQKTEAWRNANRDPNTRKQNDHD